jgi:hypothetical protein
LPIWSSANALLHEIMISKGARHPMGIQEYLYSLRSAPKCILYMRDRDTL